MAPADVPRDVVPPEVDQSQPSVARVYDALLGGKDNYAVDREVCDRLLAVAPELGTVAWDCRRFLARVTRFLAAEAGIGQFLDCGAGLPTAENTHQIAQRENLDAIVVYVDNDPIAVAHGRALLAGHNASTHFLGGDLTEPDRLLADSSLVKRFDWARPIALYQLGTLHLVPDEREPRKIMARFVEALPSGSYVVVAHLGKPGAADPEAADLAERLEWILQNSAIAKGYFRTREEIIDLFGGLELVEPGLVAANDWWPDGPRVQPSGPARRLLFGGVARKP